MTCNECIHFNACRNLLEAFCPEYKGKRLIFTKNCKYFKNKADFVEVVRCKDCKYLKQDNDFATGRYCSLRNVNGGKYCKDNDFCSYGERRGTNG